MILHLMKYHVLYINEVSFDVVIKEEEFDVEEFDLIRNIQPIVGIRT